MIPSSVWEYDQKALQCGDKPRKPFSMEAGPADPTDLSASLAVMDQGKV